MNQNPAVDINTEVVTTIRELEEGDWFITQTRIRKGGPLEYLMQQKTSNPFVARTLAGSNQRCYPSARCHPITILPS